MQSLHEIAQDRYNFSANQLVIFSSVFIYLEQLEEILPSALAILILAVEGLFLVGGLPLIFDLRSLFILSLTAISLLLSIMSSLFYFNISLNIVTLFHLIMLPAFLFEFLLKIGYLFLFNTKSLSNTLSKENNVKLKGLQLVFDTAINTSSTFLLVITLASFGILGFCKTYNFSTLFVVLFSTCFNTLIHISLFYPTLLVVFGPSWRPARIRSATKSQVDQIQEK
jgi:hypothetical protein